MATLTGAQGHVSGKHHAAILSNNEELERRACVAGRKSGDLVHPLPFCPDLHFLDLKSPVADMRNANFGKTQATQLFILSFLFCTIELTSFFLVLLGNFFIDIFQ